MTDKSLHVGFSTFSCKTLLFCHLLHVCRQGNEMNGILIKSDGNPFTKKINCKYDLHFVLVNFRNGWFWSIIKGRDREQEKGRRQVKM